VSAVPRSKRRRASVSPFQWFTLILVALFTLVPLYTTKPHGSGMGLALSREIVEAHRGSLDVSNRPDGGAWIRVQLAGRVVPALGDPSRSRLTLTRG